ncbi:MAG: hypothetical protein E3J52_09100 [Promethearchaeota archaeon]|nr:MAG: hypothetical protein E3J52_09100 [Candidatus Lokiarchaeota archaeon]
MRNLSKNQVKKIKDFVFKNGRLLERNLFLYFFENGNKDAVIKALLAYQNLDGGFGNGIEPDLLCPDSTAIGAETAMYILDLLEYVDNEITDHLFAWIIKEQNEEGYINHPPKNLYNYPFQEWWSNPDDLRIFALSGFLKKWGLKDATFFEKVKYFYSNSSLPNEFTFYEYPYFIYLKYLGKNKEEKKMLQQIINQFPSIFEKNKEHYPLFGRHWYHALDIVDKKVVENEADNFLNGLKDDGGLKIIYQNFPWWRPIWTLDGLIIAKIWGIIDFQSD